jgi:hypothetical protein
MAQGARLKADGKGSQSLASGRKAYRPEGKAVYYMCGSRFHLAKSKGTLERMGNFSDRHCSKKIDVYRSGSTAVSRERDSPESTALT